MPFIDSLGSWDFIGILTATENWSFFEHEVIGQNTNTFRLTFDCDWEKRNFRYGSYGLLRFCYVTGSDVINSPALKVWPQVSKQIRELYLPSAFQSNAALVKSVSLRKVNKKYGYEMPDLDPPWTLKLELLLID